MLQGEGASGSSSLLLSASAACELTAVTEADAGTKTGALQLSGAGFFPAAVARVARSPAAVEERLQVVGEGLGSRVMLVALLQDDPALCSEVCTGAPFLHMGVTAK